jgi:two-component system NtrC family response regulator
MENKIRRAVIMCDSKLLTALDLGLDDAESLSINLRQVRVDAEKSALHKALSFASGNISSAAKLLGVSRPTLYDLVKKHGIHLDSE